MIAIPPVKIITVKDLPTSIPKGKVLIVELSGVEDQTLCFAQTNTGYSSAIADIEHEYRSGFQIKSFRLVDTIEPKSIGFLPILEDGEKLTVKFVIDNTNQLLAFDLMPYVQRYQSVKNGDDLMDLILDCQLDPCNEVYLVSIKVVPSVINLAMY